MKTYLADLVLTVDENFFNLTIESKSGIETLRKLQQNLNEIWVMDFHILEGVACIQLLTDKIDSIDPLSVIIKNVGEARFAY